MSKLLTDAELKSRTWPLPQPVLDHITTLTARLEAATALLRQIHISTNRGWLYAETTENEWLRDRNAFLRQPDADGGQHE